MAGETGPHGPELFAAWTDQLRIAYESSVEATDGRLAALAVFIGYTDDGQRRIDTRLLAPQAAMDKEGAETIMTTILTEALEAFLFNEPSG